MTADSLSIQILSLDICKCYPSIFLGSWTSFSTEFQLTALIRALSLCTATLIPSWPQLCFNYVCLGLQSTSATVVLSSRISGTVGWYSAQPVVRKPSRLVLQVLTLSGLSESSSFRGCNCCWTTRMRSRAARAAEVLLNLQSQMAWKEAKYILNCLACWYNPDILALLSPFVVLSCFTVFQHLQNCRCKTMTHEMATVQMHRQPEQVAQNLPQNHKHTGTTFRI